jgi:pseudouridine-5'-phosphate glycosidase
MTNRILIAEEVSDALAAGRPVVALESTIISHGMPYPRNREVALAAEGTIREQGCVPATVAILEGHPRVGLTEEQIERLAAHGEVAKVSRRDLSYAVAMGQDGATTVCTTMMLAHAAGIVVFATGGIGGVHRDHPADLSADLAELARTPVIVVSAGAKAILDLDRTLEVLETLGVPVIGLGTDEFPAFYSRSSGLPAPLRVEAPEEVAGIYRTHRALALEQGLLVANPIPAADEIPRDLVETWIFRALQELESERITGKRVTPFLLGRIVELSGGSALEANIALLSNNIRVACRIAAALSQPGDAAGRDAR